MTILLDVDASPLRSDPAHIRRLEALDLWRGPIAVEFLPGGITNHNYLVRDAEQVYVARLCVERSLLGINRRNEVACQRTAHACAVAPAVVHHGDGVLVSQHLPGRTLTPADLREPAMIARLAALLRRLHDSWDQFAGNLLDFSAFQAVRAYARTARRLGAHLPDDIDVVLDDARRLSQRLAPCRPALCHNDLLASNIIADDDRVWLVDWEYGGIGHPLFDLANACANAAFPEPLEVRLLAEYRGDVTPADLRALRILKAMSYLREALWSVIQTVASDIDFDYHQYAADNFHAYRAARGRLEPS